MNETQKKEGMKKGLPSKWVLLSSLIALIIGCIGYFSLDRGLPLFYTFAHLGALGVLGLIGGVASILARKKGRSYWMALLLSILLPIVAGIVGALMIGNQVSCGGSLSLLIAIIVTGFYALISKKTSLETGQVG
ncbi:MAG: hypothetical protein GY839_02035 [candidate division Zixibacteria bacterium]|nr:hypothetical protein [candidate division Zixibacteria bacterium]